MMVVSGFAQTAQDTVRARLFFVDNPDKLIFTLLEEEGGRLKVQLGGKPKEIAPSFYALDLRRGDTLTVTGIRKAKKSNESKLVSATILNVDYASDHDDQFAFLLSMDPKPSFLGLGTSAFSKWVNTQLVYPEQSKKLKSEGRVLLRFTIEKSGELSNISVKESSGDSFLDAEALRVVRSAPAWEPGYVKGKPAKTTLIFPVNFRLRNPKNDTGVFPM